MSSQVLNSSAKSNSSDQLLRLIEPWVTPLGYQVIHIELHSHQQKSLRVFIDFLNSSNGKGTEQKGIGIEDCVKVSHLLSEQLDLSPEALRFLPDSYELEVSSPGVDRPLRTANDFDRFAGHEIRIHVYRPLSGEEIGNETYREKNPKQKNFKGTLVGFKEEKVVLSLPSQGKGSPQFGRKLNQASTAQKKARKGLELVDTNSAEGIVITIPLPLISKANLEPDFSFEASDERE